MNRSKRAVSTTGEPLDLVLFKFDSCPFCVRVLRKINELGVPATLRDVRCDPGARDELRKVGGSTQVPCLFINGEPLYESTDIVRFLEAEVLVQ